MAKDFFKKLKEKVIPKSKKKKKVKHPSKVRIKIEKREFNPTEDTHL